MNWIKTLWSNLVNKTAVSSTLSVVEETEEPTEEKKEKASEIFEKVLLEAGISEGVISKYEILSAFEEWYAGPSTQEEIKNSIEDFREAAGGAIKAKLSRVQ